MRIGLSITFVVLIAMLVVCNFLAFRSKKPIGKSVGILLVSLILPVWGNLLIISSDKEILSLTGCYVYFLGMDVLMAATIWFTIDYCNLKKIEWPVKIAVYSVLLLDMIQLLVNIATHHAFILEPRIVEGSRYYGFTPLWGQSIHRAVDYVILGLVLITFVIYSIKSIKVYSEKYIVILLAMLAVAIWQTVYIFTRIPMDVSMIGFAVFGIIVFFLALYYRPLRLLDRMLGTIASRMPEALFFFDKSNNCIWMNDKAKELLKIEEDNYESVYSDLKKILGDEYEKEGVEWINTVTKGSGDNITSYVIEKHAVTNEKEHEVGSYLSVRDNSEEQANLARETYNAIHDSLTHAYNRAGFDELMDSMDISNCFLVLIDLDSFKETNDQFGHVMGDKVLVEVVKTLTRNFRNDDYICRIGGDEFAVIINSSDKSVPNEVEKRINKINDEISSSEVLPKTSISSGGAFGKDAENSYELYNNADHALYNTKFQGKRGFSLFKKR